jgi:hypothetical protein
MLQRRDWPGRCWPRRSPRARSRERKNVPAPRAPARPYDERHTQGVDSIGEPLIAFGSDCGSTHGQLRPPSWGAGARQIHADALYD